MIHEISVQLKLKTSKNKIENEIFKNFLSRHKLLCLIATELNTNIKFSTPGVRKYKKYQNIVLKICVRQCYPIRFTLLSY